MLKTIINIFNSQVHVLIPRRITATLLASFYILAFVMSPYWSLARSESGVIINLSVIIGLGAIWSYFSAGDIQTITRVKTFLLLGFLLVGMTALNNATLTSVIPWRGDESTFIVRTRDLMSRVPIKFALLASFLFALIVFAVARRSSWMIFGGILLESYAIIQFLLNNPFKGIGAVLLLRWPYVNYWFYIIVPIIAKYLWDPNHEFLYRIIPLVSAVGLVWMVQNKLTRSNFLINLLWGGAIATIPIVFYYSSILYAELSAVFLMMIVCFHANDLLCNDFNNIRRNPGWPALVLLGFVKETVIVFLLCFLISRTVISVRRQITVSKVSLQDKIKNYLIGELPVVFCVLYPYVLYTVFRVYLINIRSYIRGYSPNLTNLFNLTLYKITAQSFIEQFGVFLPFFFCGLLLLLWKRDYIVAFFTLFLFIGVPLFYGIDTNSQAYLGYSRFNLFVLPPILVGSVAALNQISKWGKMASVSIACISISLNLILSPVYLDGTKVPYWGNYLLDTSEHYYPYDQALLWLKNNHSSERILFSEMFYNYYLSFYFAKLDWHPTYDVQLSPEHADEASTLSNILSDARLGRFGLVLYQVKGNDIPQPVEYGEFCLEKIFKNQAHTLLLFSRITACIDTYK
jgi:hypothetical protein